MSNPIERIWNEILSREPERIQTTFKKLPSREKVAVRAHLIKITTESGWHPPQIESAQIALKAIKNIPDL